MIMAHGAPRVPPVVPGTDPALRLIEGRIQAERGRISPLYQVLLNSPPLAEGWEALLTAIRNRSGVPADLREIVILRVAVLNRAPYEFDAHVPHARRAGVDDAMIESLRDPGFARAIDDPIGLVVALTDAMTRDVHPPEALMAQVTQRFDARTTLELVATVAAYNMVSRLLVALEIHG